MTQLDDLLAEAEKWSERLRDEYEAAEAEDRYGYLHAYDDWRTLSRLIARVRELEAELKASELATGTPVLGETWNEAVSRLESRVDELLAENDRMNRRNAELTASEEQMAGKLRVAESHRKMVCGENERLRRLSQPVTPDGDR